MLSSRTRCALRALSDLAQHAPQARTTEQIASATGLLLPTLAKTLQALNRAGIVKTQRGAGGGVCLSRDPHALSVMQVIEAIDPTSRVAHPPHDTLCPCLHRRLASVTALVEVVLRRTTIAELLPTNASPAPHRSSLDDLLDQVKQVAGI